MKLTIIAMIVFLGGFLLLGYMHEQVHIQIFKDYDIDSHVEYLSNFPNLATVTDEAISMEDCPENCILAHNINEAISYPLGIFYIVFGTMFIIIIGLLEEMFN